MDLEYRSEWPLTGYLDRGWTKCVTDWGIVFEVRFEEAWRLQSEDSQGVNVENDSRMHSRGGSLLDQEV